MRAGSLLFIVFAGCGGAPSGGTDLSDQEESSAADPITEAPEALTGRSYQCSLETRDAKNDGTCAINEQGVLEVSLPALSLQSPITTTGFGFEFRTDAAFARLFRQGDGAFAGVVETLEGEPVGILRLRPAGL